MSHDCRKKYDDGMVEAAALPEPKRKAKVNHIVRAIRHDLFVPPLTLCAFLQDHAQLIRETLK